MTIQERLNKLQPFITGIRYMEGFPILDVKFQDKWGMPKHEKIKYDVVKGTSLMFYCEDKNIGIDELLDHVEYIINHNREKQAKTEFLERVAIELQELMKGKLLELNEKLKTTKLSDLEQVKFNICEIDNGIKSGGLLDVVRNLGNEEESNIKVTANSEIIEKPIENKIEEKGLIVDIGRSGQLDEKVSEEIQYNPNPPVELYQDEYFDPEEKLVPTPVPRKTQQLKMKQKVELPPRN